MSIFSGDVGSSASGTSDLDHVNVEELSEGSLQETLEEAQRQIRRLTLETNMFQGVIFKGVHSSVSCCERTHAH